MRLSQDNAESVLLRSLIASGRLVVIFCYPVWFTCLARAIAYSAKS
ncbi:MAG: hypothetical protein DSM106950_17205 [Stigonema ocellatum SAG 48.90 = DSM 106950]|nr:hypothetical protein [Stigonema ocellatum SAG 48.90 = DSM 106950]